MTRHLHRLGNIYIHNQHLCTRGPASSWHFQHAELLYAARPRLGFISINSSLCWSSLIRLGTGNGNPGLGFVHTSRFFEASHLITCMASQYLYWHDVGLCTFQSPNLDSCFASPSCIDVQWAKRAQDGWTEYSTTFLLGPIFHIHPRSLDMLTNKAARHVCFEGAWKEIK